jgi:hypothetical protein
MMTKLILSLESSRLVVEEPADRKARKEIKHQISTIKDAIALIEELNDV